MKTHFSFFGLLIITAISEAFCSRPGLDINASVTNFLISSTAEAAFLPASTPGWWYALIFVRYAYSPTVLSNRAINYVFSSNNEIGKNWPSPYTKKSIDYVLSSTKKNLNEWVTVKANVKEDFMNLLGIEVNELTAVAIMTDTDNSKLKAISYYQNIYFSSN